MHEESGTIDALKKYAWRLKEYQDKVDKWNEEQVKGYLIEPLLKSLRWDTSDPEFVLLEYPITIGTETKRVDYVLMSNKSLVCVVEAKTGEIEDIHAKQALSYAKHLGVLWAIVTNGRRVCVYGSDFYIAENVKNALIMDINISPETIDNNSELLRYLAKGILDQEDVYKVFKDMNQKRTLLLFLQSKKEELIDVIADWVGEQWDKGLVNKEVLISSLEVMFGKVEAMARKQDERQPCTSYVTIVVAGDWKYRGDLGQGIFELKQDPNKKIDVSKSSVEVEEQLQKLGLRLSSKSALGGFCYNLRREAGLVRRKR